MTRHCAGDRQVDLIQRRTLFKAATGALVLPTLSPLTALSRGAVGPLETPASMTKLALRAAMNKVVCAGRRLVAVGERGIILFSDDDGQQWHQAKVPVSVTLTSAIFIDGRLGWAAGHGGVVLHTVDGGESWVRQLDGESLAKATLERVRAMPEGAGSQQASLVRQAEQLVADGPDKPFLTIHFIDAERGMAVGGYGLAAATSDGGRTWVPCLDRIDNPRGMHLYGLASVGSSWAIAGEQGFLARSIDNAVTFTRLDTPFKGSFFTLLPTRGGEMLVAGLLGNACRFDPATSSVMDIGLPTKATILSSLRLRSGRIVLLEALGRLLVSNDGGLSFSWASAPGQGPLTSLAEAGDGTIVGSGLSGVRRLSIDSSSL